MSYRKVGEARTPAEWAQLHAGIEFIHPERERQMMQLRAMGWNVDMIAQQFAVDPLEVERSLGRTARILITWERNACRWATHYVAVEPNSAYPNGSRSRDKSLERDQRNPRPDMARQLRGKRIG